MPMLPYIIVHTYIDMAHIGDILDLSHIVLRFIRSHIASRAHPRAICWKLHFDNVLALPFCCAFPFPYIPPLVGLSVNGYLTCMMSVLLQV